MFAKLTLIAVLGIVSADRQERFLFPNQQNPFQNPFGGGSGGGGTTFQSCTPQQGYCSLQCDNGYVKGPGGCDFCMCNTHQQDHTTTIAPLMPNTSGMHQALSTDAPTSSTETPIATSTATTTPATSTTESECLQARHACASSCGDAGYLIDPTDCTFCLCKGELG